MAIPIGKGRLREESPISPRLYLAFLRQLMRRSVGASFGEVLLSCSVFLILAIESEY